MPVGNALSVTWIGTPSARSDGMRTMILGIWMLVICAPVAHASAPAIHVNIRQAGIDDAERAFHTNALSRQMEALLRDTKLDVRTVDICVSKISIVIGTDKVTVSAEVRIVLSTKNDQILSVASGTARFDIDKRQYRPEKTRELRGQVLADALDGVGKRVRASSKQVALR
jgi:hypothetical protein